MNIFIKNNEISYLFKAHWAGCLAIMENGRRVPIDELHSLREVNGIYDPCFENHYVIMRVQNT